MPRPPNSGRSASDPSGPAERLSLRLPPSVHAETLAAAERAGLPWGTWAAQQLAEAAQGVAERPRFGTLEQVLAYVRGLADDERPDLRRRLDGALFDGTVPLLLAAIAASWLAGRGSLIAAACESFARGER